MITTTITGSGGRRGIPTITSAVVLKVKRRCSCPIKSGGGTPGFGDLGGSIMAISGGKGFITITGKGTGMGVNGGRVAIRIRSTPAKVTFTQSRFSLKDNRACGPPLDISNDSVGAKFLFRSSSTGVLSMKTSNAMANGTLNATGLAIGACGKLSSTYSMTIRGTPRDISFPRRGAGIFTNRGLGLTPILPSNDTSTGVACTSSGSTITGTRNGRVITITGNATGVATAAFGKGATAYRVAIIRTPCCVEAGLSPGGPVITLSFSSKPGGTAADVILSALRRCGNSTAFFVINGHLRRRNGGRYTRHVIGLNYRLNGRACSRSRCNGSIATSSVGGKVGTVGRTAKCRPATFEPANNCVSSAVGRGTGTPVYV